MKSQSLEFGKDIHVQTRPLSWAYAIQLFPGGSLPDIPFVLTCTATVTGPGTAGICSLNAHRDDFLHSVFLTEADGQQTFDVYCGSRAEFGALVVRTGETAVSANVVLTVVDVKPVLHKNFTIYQFGKVGSQSVEAALRRVVPAKWIERHHFLSSQSFVGSLKMGLRVLTSHEASMYPTYFERYGVLHQLKAAAKARTTYLKAQKDGRALIITGIRDPVEACIATFFQQLDVYCPGLQYGKQTVFNDAHYALKRFYAVAKMASENHPPQSVTDEFLRSLFLSGIANWFQKEFRTFTGVDLVRANIDPRAPFSRFKENGHDILAFRMEHLTKALPDMFTSMGLCYRPTQMVNVGSQKPSGAIYDKFKELFVETPLITSLLRNTEFARRFYPVPLSKGADQTSMRAKQLSA